ncbi:rab-GTPase-TBC domain-containing protein [Lipomyces kononenkoae]|uniref:Rab-GTPase-TBC domain-containing protein n=1 Tax=Lipomyces kononenkoae TaxID=34357 RepID=A0ACC3T7E1_LIPKO
MEVIALYQTADRSVPLVPSVGDAVAHDASLSAGSPGVLVDGQNSRYSSGAYHEPIPVPLGKTNGTNTNLSSSNGSGNTKLGVLSPSTASRPHPLFLPGSFASSTWSNRSSSGTSAVDARDRYGFRKQSQYITLQEYDDWWVRYEKHCQRRQRKWETLIQDCGIPFDEEGGPISFPPKSKKVKRYVRKGIPAAWRGAAWFWYARGHDYLRDNYGLYDRLWQQGMSSPPPDSELIERDLHRTFPDNIHFRNAEWQNGSVPSTPGSAVSSKSTSSGRRHSNVPEMPIVQALRRVLLAFSLYVPKTGYCQSLNFVAGLLLLFMDEEKAFWMLVIITQKYLPGMHEINLEGANVDQGVLMMCVKESLPRVWNKIGAGLDGFHHDEMIMRLPPITLCTAAWFMSGFIGVLPIESVLRVWDCFFYDDSKVFFRIALTIFKLGESQIESVRDPMEVFQLVQTVPKHLLDANALIQACFRRRNGFGHISQDEITERRKFVAEKRRHNASAADGGVTLGPKGDVLLRSSAGESSDFKLSSRYKHYDVITGTYQSKSNFGKRMQLLRMGSTNMLSLHARNDYFGTSQSEARKQSGLGDRSETLHQDDE